MGQLTIRVAGRNITATTVGRDEQSCVGWYLAPFLDWLATNLVALLHEECLPDANRIERDDLLRLAGRLRVNDSGLAVAPANLDLIDAACVERLRDEVGRAPSIE